VTRASPEAGREVWYRLTDAGRDLEPVIDALTLWGIQHARQPPAPGEPVHPEPAMIGTKVWLNEYPGAAADGLVWLWRFPGQDDYALRSTDGKWELTRGKEDSAAVTVIATPERWAAFLTSPRARRRLPTKGIGLEGSAAEIERFVGAFYAKLAPASKAKR
jgi:HxlR-like helix-turn-helix